MYINELSCDTNIVVEVSNNVSKLQFNTNRIKIHNKDDVRYMVETMRRLNGVPLIPVNLIKAGERELSFLNDSLTLSVKCIVDGKPYIWNNVMIPKILLPSGDSIHLIVSADSIESQNQRTEYRVFLGLDARVKDATGEIDSSVTLRDISNAGVAILVPKINDFKVGDVFTVTWIDRKWVGTKQSFKDTQYSMKVRVVRLDSNYDLLQTLVGCESLGTTSIVSRYIAIKQRERLKLRGARYVND